MEYKMKPIWIGMEPTELPNPSVLCVFKDNNAEILVLGFITVFEYPTQYVVEMFKEETYLPLDQFDGYAEVPNYEGGHWVVRGNGIYAEK